MATEQCVRPVEKTLHEGKHEHHPSSGQTQVHKESKGVSQSQGHNQLSHDTPKTHAESKTVSHGVHAQQHVAQSTAMLTTCHGKKEKKMKDKKEKDKDRKEKKEKKEKKTESKKKPEKEKSKHKKSKDDSSSDSD
ncbi:hypothetical protein ES332_A11G027600v1 [Gossypium tomentosum]|uniref:Uncharacterized protein n=1 Tax=Gossypium tomentosum TaxID=34277 RepID=A0A5D2N609_GOSTO|nr:hypothetical protein ES332_A11G027600v1 [Gossypium tomentosum]